MAAEIKIVEEARAPLAMNPKKFALWLFMATVVILFAGWTSAYIVKRGDTGWAEIQIPDIFWVSSGLMILSHFTMVLATMYAKRDNLEPLKVTISLTALLGLTFLGAQVIGFGQLIKLGQYFTGGNVSHSFIYVLAGVHGLHVVSGVIVLIFALVAVFRLKIHSKNMNQMEMCATYWHFLGILWLYLFGFLLLFP